MIRTHLKTSLLAASLAASLGSFCTARLGAQTPQPPARGGDGPGVVIEKTVYVPFEKLESVFEKEGRGIFLPYEEFLKLWQAAQPKPVEVRPDEPPAQAAVRGGSYVGTVTGGAARFTVTLEVEGLKRGWSELPLGFKNVAVESVELSNPRAILTTRAAAAAGAPVEYVVLLPEPGKAQVKLVLSTKVLEEPGKRSISLGIPPTAVSRVELLVPEEAARIEVLPASAVTQSRPAEKATQVVAYLGNASEVTLSWLPPAGKAVQGGAVVLAEQLVHVSVGERILKTSSSITYQALRGEASTLRIRAPEGMRLISVKGENIREWKEEGGIVVVELHAAIKSGAYPLGLSFERILTETPPTLSVPVPRVEDVLRESGWIVLGHESGLNVRVARTQGLSQADRDEVPEALREGLGVGFRYLAPPVGLDLEIEKITPQLRSFTTSVVTLGKEEDVWVGWIDYTIARTGVFRLELRVPARWSVASVGDPANVEDFQTADADGARTITVSLKSKALGTFRLPFRLTAQGSAATGESTHSPPIVLGVTEDRGLFGVASPKAFDVSTLTREKATPADVDELFRSGILPQLAAGSGLPLAYSYREQPASVKVRLEAKKTEIELLSQHLVEIADGGVKLTHLLDFEILYAAVDRLTFTAPASLDAALKIEAKEKKEVRKVSTDQGVSTWEVTLQTPTVGTVSLTVTHEADLKALEPGKRFAFDVPIFHSKEAREKGFVAIRKQGTLEILPEATGLETIDLGDLPDKLRRGQIYGAFRYFGSDPRIVLGLTRYEYQPLATAVVNLLRLESVLSEEASLRTRATFIVQNAERQYLELDLEPEWILSLHVAGKAQQPRKRQGTKNTLVQIPTGSGDLQLTVVFERKLAQSPLGSSGSLELLAPRVLEGVPVGKVELELYVPPQFVYYGWGGSLRERTIEGATIWTQILGRIKNAVGTAQVRGQQQGFAPQGAQAPAPTPGIDVELPTRGLLLYRFDGMSDQPTLSFKYASRGLFRVATLLAFLGALAAGWFILGPGPGKVFPVLLGLVLAPLALTWFTTEPVADLFAAALAGGLAALAARLVCAVWRRVRDWRAARLALAPDPYLEEALPASPPPAAPAPAAPPEKPAEGEVK